MENGKSKSQPKDFLHPLPRTWLIHPPVFRLIGSRIHSPPPLPDSISRLIKDRWPERTHPERSSPLPPSYRKTRNEEFASVSWDIEIDNDISFQWFGKKALFNEKTAIRRDVRIRVLATWSLTERIGFLC